MSTQYYHLDWLTPQQPFNNSWTMLLQKILMCLLRCTMYLDDILVFSKNEDDHAEHLHWVLSKLNEQKLKAKH